ncbi:MAG: ATP-binding protein [Candidatus Krumholzibacteria bacterium]|nr:ATP-binding protein [Candidatus Krumholzibacteria bacterium]
MEEAKLPKNEAERLAALNTYEVLDTEPEAAFDDLTRLAARHCHTPIALVSLIDTERQWFKSKVGLTACETSRSLAFCAHAILKPDNALIVEDAFLDPRFADNPLVTGEPQVRFYAGAPLVNADGMALGTLCVIGHKPGKLDEEQLDTLRALARQVVSQLELRKSCRKLEESARELGRANEELRDFTQIAAHDLQEPLRKLISFSRLLQTDLGGDLSPRAEKDLNFITSAASRMQMLVTDLLELSRTGSSALKRDQIAVGDCVRSAVDALSLRIEEKSADIVVDELPFVRGDATLLSQLFQNLISNSLKFVTGEKPRIHITCARESGEMVLGIKDNGIGIDPKFAEKIFSPFKRLHGRTEYEGTGIGLAIARKAVERHGGRIWVESALGEGAHFKFTLSGIDYAEAPDRGVLCELE